MKPTCRPARFDYPRSYSPSTDTLKANGPHYPSAMQGTSVGTTAQDVFDNVVDSGDRGRQPTGRDLRLAGRLGKIDGIRRVTWDSDNEQMWAYAETIDGVDQAITDAQDVASDAHVTIDKTLTKSYQTVLAIRDL